MNTVSFPPTAYDALWNFSAQIFNFRTFITKGQNPFGEYMHFICHFWILLMSNKWYFKVVLLRIKKVKCIISKVVLSHPKFCGKLTVMKLKIIKREFSYILYIRYVLFLLKRKQNVKSLITGF